MRNILFCFCYNSCIHESAAATISIHKTRKGAEMALEFHKAESFKEWEENEKWRKEDMKNESKEVQEAWSFKFGEHEAWFIKEMELLD